MERRVLIHAPRGRDASVVQGVIESMGLTTVVCGAADDLLSLLGRGASAAVMTEESIAQVPQGPLYAWLSAQPSWSDFPFVVLAARDGQRRSPKGLDVLQSLGNVILLERPVHAETLSRAVDAAVRARSRQYATRMHLQQLDEARADVERLNRELEGRIAARTRELASANDRLMAEIAERERAQAALLQGQKMEAIGRLTGGIAHDFNNLLHVVNMNLDLVARVATDQRVLAISGRAKAAVGKGAKLTGQLLSFARNQSLLPRLTDVNALLIGVQELVAVSLGPKIGVELGLSETPCWSVLDANQLEMAILNLAVNARDAMPDGGSLKLRTTHSNGAAVGLPAGDYVVVAVQDTGTGIAPGVLGKVFDPFFTTKPMGSGTGLGLSQVYGFAQQSGGVAAVQSEVGQGTQVQLYFPASLDRLAPGHAEAQPELLASAGRHRVLVVEDDAEVRRAISESLVLLGYQVTEAQDGPAGLQALTDGVHDLLVVDYAMPGMNGAEVIAKARGIVSELPVILATGYADMAEVGRVLGTQSILIKPFDIRTLSEAVSKALHAGRVSMA
ncbi:MAG: response regulator [Comamonadaceae bacterium]|nr:MAG: response regulator [Comamonadaceae bacterium]